MSVIRRNLSDRNCARAKDELRFLIDYMSHPRFRRELAIEFRGPSELGVYDRGFRLAQIKFARDGNYRVTTHPRFVRGTPLEDHTRFPRDPGTRDTAVRFTVPPRRIHSLLQLKHIAKMRSRIKEIPHKEEIGVAHVIAADTMRGTDVVVIDREVGDSSKEHVGERLDLLALQHVGKGTYRFLGIEVKLGNNPELDERSRLRAGERSAVQQIEGYVKQIDANHDDYAACYRRNVSQKIELGLLDNWTEAPEIVRDTKGMLAVVGYMGIAEPHLEHISRAHGGLWVKTFDYGLQSHNGRIKGLR